MIYNNNSNMIQENRYVDFITKHKLTQPQFLLLHLLYKNKKDLIKKYKQTFPTDDNSMIGIRALNDLIDRKFVIKTDKGYTLGELFLDVYIDEYTAGDEIWELYPKFIIIKEVNIPLTTMDKNLFRKIYIDKILYNREEHLEVVKDIQYGKEKQLINLGIDKFLNSEFWKTIREQRLADDKHESINNIYEENDF